MKPEAVALLGGLLFLLIAIVGGGFTIKEIIMPGVPRWARIASLLVGVALVVPYFASALDERGGGGFGVSTTPGPNGAAAGLAAKSPPAAQRRVVEDSAPHKAQDGIEVSGLLATGEHADVSVGDRITIQFSLRNAGSETTTFEYAFIAARNPRDDNVDFGETEQGTVLAPGDAVDISSSIIVDLAGMWKFWPCYYVRAHSGESDCPDEWRRFEVPVDQRRRPCTGSARPTAGSG
jgi:hypothetical protein